MRFFGKLMGVIFGLLFTGAGSLIAFETAVPTYFTWIEMKEWNATQAKIIDAGGEDNAVTASYQYEVTGNKYQGERVHIANFKDNIGSYHTDMRRYLIEKRRAGQPVTIWFDPDNPVDSVIDRDMRWGLFVLMTVFCSVFIILGLVVAIASLKGKATTHASPRFRLAEMRRSWKAAQTSGEYSRGFVDYVKSGLHRGSLSRSEYSDPSLQPWLGNPHWQSSHIRSNAKRGMYFMWLFAIAWSVMTSPLLFVLGDELKRENYAALLGLLFPLVGIFLLKRAWNLTREWRRFGVIELEMDPFPGAIGGHVGGRLLIEGTYQSDIQYNVELACVHSYVSGSSKNRSRRESILWSENGAANSTIAASSSGMGTRLSFRFDVPGNLPESDVEQSGDYYLWRIKFSADTPGANLDRDYIIPVFRTEDRTSSVQHDLSGQAAKIRAKATEVSQMALSAGQLDQTALARSVRFNEQGGFSRFYYPMFRNKALTLFAFIFAAGFGFASYSMATEFGGGTMGILVMIFSLPFAIIGLLATIATIYLPLNNLRVVIGNGTLQVTRRLFIVPVKRHQLATYDVTRLEVKRSGSTGQGSKQVVHFKISAHTKDKKKITIAEDVDGEDLAYSYKEFLERKLGIDTSRSR